MNNNHGNIEILIVLTLSYFGILFTTLVLNTMYLW